MMWALGILTSLNLFLVPILSFNLELVKQQHFSTDFSFNGTRVGGLSSLAYNPDLNVYYAASDRSSSNAPTPRFFEMTMDLSPSQTSDWVKFRKVNFVDTDPLVRTDIEGIVYDSEKKIIYMANEGSSRLEEQSAPSVFKLETNGALIDPDLEFVIPEYYKAPADDATIGVYRTKGFETATLTENGNMLIVATEQALSQDRLVPGIEGSLRSRVLFLDKRTRQPIREHVYVIADPPQENVENIDTHGLVDLITLNETHYLATELTTYSDNTSSEINLFEVSFASATDTLGKETVPEDCIFAEKSRLCQLVGGSFGIMSLGNIEGASFGPDSGSNLADKHLIYVADSDYRDRTSFYLFKLTM